MVSRQAANAQASSSSNAPGVTGNSKPPLINPASAFGMTVRFGSRTLILLFHRTSRFMMDQLISFFATRTACCRLQPRGLGRLVRQNVRFAR